jgi:hypothetical protein
MNYTQTEDLIAERVQRAEVWIPAPLASVRELAFQAYSELIHGDTEGPIEFKINDIKFVVSN